MKDMGSCCQHVTLTLILVSPIIWDNTQERNDLFKSWLASGQNLELLGLVDLICLTWHMHNMGITSVMYALRQCEARILALRSDQVEGRKTYKLVSVKDMSRVYGFGERKIASIIARGNGVPDEDTPEIAEETRYWILVGQEKVDTSTVRLC